MVAQLRDLDSQQPRGRHAAEDAGGPPTRPLVPSTSPIARAPSPSRRSPRRRRSCARASTQMANVMNGRNSSREAETPSTMRNGAGGVSCHSANSRRTKSYQVGQPVSLPLGSAQPLVSPLGTMWSRICWLRSWVCWLRSWICWVSSWMVRVRSVFSTSSPSCSE